MILGKGGIQDERADLGTLSWQAVVSMPPHFTVGARVQSLGWGTEILAAGQGTAKRKGKREQKLEGGAVTMASCCLLVKVALQALSSWGTSVFGERNGQGEDPGVPGEPVSEGQTGGRVK